MASYRAYLVLYCFLHSSQVNRYVRSIGHQTSIRTKQCTGEVQSLLYRIKKKEFILW